MAINERDKTICGIVYKESFNGKPVNQDIKALYKNQKSRGKDGFGFYIPEMDRLAHNVREDRILALLDNKRYKAQRIMFHHRFPTSTANVQTGAHPYSTRRNGHVFDHEYVLVHNGVLSNSAILKAQHEKLGIKYLSVQPNGKFNDSEALLYDVALYLDGKQDQLNATGSIAFIVTSGERLLFGHNYGSPLRVNMTTRGLTISSAGGGTEVATNKLYDFNRAEKVFKMSDLEIPSWASARRTEVSRAWNDEDRQQTLLPSSTVGPVYQDNTERIKKDYPHLFGMLTNNHSGFNSETKNTAIELLESFEDMDESLRWAQEMHRDLDSQMTKIDRDIEKTGEWDRYGSGFYEELVNSQDLWHQVINYLKKIDSDGTWESIVSESYSYVG